MTSRDETVVIGAGVVGLSVALRLAKAGLSVTVLDPLPPASRASFGNAGIINPAAVMPMAGPGMLPKVPGWLIDPMGPLFIPPRYFPKVLPWLLRYVGAGRPDRVRKSAEGMHLLHRDCVQDWTYLVGEAFMAENTRFRGGLQLWSKPAPKHVAELGAEIRKRYGIEAESLDAEGLRRLVPDISPKMTSGIRMIAGGFTTDPAALCAKLVAEFTAIGGKILARSVEGIGRKAAGRFEIVTNLHAVHATRVVVAAGVWSSRLVSPLGIKVPLEAERGYHALLPDHNIRLDHSIGFKERGFSVTPMAAGLRLAGTVEFSGRDSLPDMRRAENLVRHAAELFPKITHGTPQLWSGMRPSLPDSLPVIGPATPEGDLLLAFGHSHYGMMGASGTARIIEDFVMGRAAPEAAAFSHTRF